MILKERTKSISHLVLESLNRRTTLSSSEKSQYENQIKGYEGERAFDQILKDSNMPGLIINDLLLSTRDTFYQIDALLITDDHIYLYEVKNYTGPYFYKTDSIFSESGHALQDPVAQAERKRAYLHNFLLKSGFKIDITAHVVFINPDFYIYFLPKTESILFAGQLPAHFNSLFENLPSQSNENLILANHLIAKHDFTYRPSNLPAYSLDRLRKGILCPECQSFTYEKTRQNRTCGVCQYNESAAEAIHRTFEEFRLLFPELPLTKTRALEWCGNDWKKSRIKSVLKKHYRVHNAGRGSYYL